MSAQQNAFEGVVGNPLPGRLGKPRSSGQTMLLDKGLGLTETEDLLNLAADYIDYIKLTFGSAALYPEPVLRAKVALIKSYGVHVYPGGTFFEVALTQGRLEAYLRRCKDLGFDHVEVSDGTINLDPSARLDAIAAARNHGFPVITEVGKKEGGRPLDPAAALEQIHADLEAGAVKVIVEGRETGKGAGLFDREGSFNADDLERLVAGVPDPEQLMWEAPLKAQQVELITRFGPNVSLGNIPPADSLAVEALRRGLRGDTLQLALSVL